MTRITKAEVANGVIVNIATADADNVPEFMNDWVDAEGLSRGMVTDGFGGFVAFVPVIQASDYTLQAYQFHTLIEEIGKASQIRQAIADMGENTAARVALNKLERGAAFVRNDPLVVSLAEATGLTPEDVDTLWLQATAY